MQDLNLRNYLSFFPNWITNPGLKGLISASFEAPLKLSEINTKSVFRDLQSLNTE
jgi:hypothetical protein